MSNQRSAMALRFVVVLLFAQQLALRSWSAPPTPAQKLFIAISRGEASTVDAVLASDPPLVSMRNQQGFSPLCYALQFAGWNTENIARVLLDHGADVNERNCYHAHIPDPQGNKWGGDELTLASDSSLASKLNRQRVSPLCYELQFPFLFDIVRILLDHGADVNEKGCYYGYIPDPQGNKWGGDELTPASDSSLASKLNRQRVSPLCFALRFNTFDLDKIRALLDHQADVHERDCYGEPLLQFAAMAALNSDGAADVLLDYHADVDGQDDKGRTALFLASLNGSQPMVRVLLEHGAGVNIADEEGRTPLHVAVTEAWKMDTVQALLAYHPDVNAHDHEGYTPLGVALQNGNKDMADLLCQHGASE